MPGPVVYLDWNATAPLRAEARAAWLEAQTAYPGNPSSAHRLGQQARLAWDRAQGEAADLLGCRPHELVLTGSGSEAAALAIHSALDGAPGTVVASRIEHSSVLRNAERHRDCRELRLVDVDRAGIVDRDALVAALDDTVRLVCLHDANNELGCLQPIVDLVAAVRAHDSGIAVFVDACQGAGKRSDFDLSAFDADYAAIAGHKFGAPRGTGLCYARTGRRVAALVSGGRQQEDRRSGTEDLPGLLALVAALRAARAEGEGEGRRQRELLAQTFQRLVAARPRLRWLAADGVRLSNTMALAHPGTDGEVLVARLDLAGIAVSRGSACMARSGQPSHVVRALGLGEDLARGTIRISIGRDTTAADLERFAAAYLDAVPP